MKSVQVAGLIGMIGMATAALAQTGTLTGRVAAADNGAPLPGANVILLETDLGATTDSAGAYVLTNLPPGTYRLQASFIGYTRTTVEDVKVLFNLTTAIDIALQAEVLQGKDITVVASHQNIKREVSANLAIMDAENLQDLPIATIEDALRLQAGIEPDLTIRGGNINTVSFLVDGVNLREGRTHAPIMGLSYTALEQIQVQTSGFNAEYGNVRSGLIQMVTKNPPSDHYSGDLFIRYRPAQRMNFDTREAPESAGSPVPANQTIDDPGHDLDMTIGGPLIPWASQALRKLRFLASYRQKLEPYLDTYDRNARLDRTWQVKLVSDIKSGIKLTVAGLYSQQDGVADSASSMMPGGVPPYPWGLENDFFNREGLFKTNNIGLSDIEHQLLGATLRHSLGSHTFYELKAHRLASNYFLRPGPLELIKDRDTSSVVVWSGKFDITSRMSDRTQFKAGTEYIISQYDIASEVGDPCATRVSALGSAWTLLCGDRDFESPFHLYEAWTAAPHQGAAYVQSRFDYKTIVLNLGVRLDYFYVGGTRYLFDDFSNYLGQQDPQTREDSLRTENAERQFAWSPRLGVSFPVTMNSKLYFNYGHFYQMPQAEYLYRMLEKSFETTPGRSSVSGLGNPNIPMPRTISYEVGYDQSIFDQYLLRISGYLRDVDRQTSFRIFISDDVYYTQALPLNYNDVSGLELTLTKLKGERVRGFVNYTYMSFSSGNFGPAAVIRNPLDEIDYDLLTQDHYQAEAASQPYVHFNLELLAPSHFGPRLLGGEPLSNWRMDLLGGWRAGQVFTWSGPIIDEDNDADGIQYTPHPSLNNNLRTRDFYHLDLRLSKKIDLRFGSVQLFADVRNLLNLKYMYFERSFAMSAGNPLGDYNDYMASLHLPEDMFRNIAEDEDLYGFVPGSDRPGDYREAGVAFVPIHVIESPWQLPPNPGPSAGDGSELYYVHTTGSYHQFENGEWQTANPQLVDQVLEDQAYIDMPDKGYQTFLNPRSITLGIRITF